MRYFTFESTFKLWSNTSIALWICGNVHIFWIALHRMCLLLCWTLYLVVPSFGGRHRKCTYAVLFRCSPTDDATDLLIVVHMFGQSNHIFGAARMLLFSLFLLHTFHTALHLSSPHFTTSQTLAPFSFFYLPLPNTVPVPKLTLCSTCHDGGRVSSGQWGFIFISVLHVSGCQGLNIYSPSTGLWILLRWATWHAADVNFYSWPRPKVLLVPMVLFLIRALCNLETSEYVGFSVLFVNYCLLLLIPVNPFLSVWLLTEMPVCFLEYKVKPFFGTGGRWASGVCCSCRHNCFLASKKSQCRKSGDGHFAPLLAQSMFSWMCRNPQEGRTPISCILSQGGWLPSCDHMRVMYSGAG